MTDKLIKVVNNTLSDGSRTFDVLIGDGNQLVRIPAYGEREANDLANDIAASINNHSCEFFSLEI